MRLVPDFWYQRWDSFPLGMGQDSSRHLRDMAWSVSLPRHCPYGHIACAPFPYGLPRVGCSDKPLLLYGLFLGQNPKLLHPRAFQAAHWLAGRQSGQILWYLGAGYNMRMSLMPDLSPGQLICKPTHLSEPPGHAYVCEEAGS